MGRIRKNIKINGRNCWTLFDSGAENTYIVRSLAEHLGARRLPHAWTTRLGGRKHRVSQICDLVGTISRKPVVTQAFVVQEIGTDRKAKRPFEILFGALAMQQWGIELDLKRERLDMSRYPEEFVEFAERLSSEGGRP